MKMLQNNIVRFFTGFLLFALALSSCEQYWHFHNPGEITSYHSTLDISKNSSLSVHENNHKAASNFSCFLCNLINNIEKNYHSSTIINFNVETNHIIFNFVKAEIFDINYLSVSNKSPPFSI